MSFVSVAVAAFTGGPTTLATPIATARRRRRDITSLTFVA